MDAAVPLTIAQIRLLEEIRFFVIGKVDHDYTIADTDAKTEKEGIFNDKHIIALTAGIRVLKSHRGDSAIELVKADSQWLAWIWARYAIPNEERAVILEHWESRIVKAILHDTPALRVDLENFVSSLRFPSAHRVIL